MTVEEVAERRHTGAVAKRATYISSVNPYSLYKVCDKEVQLVHIYWCHKKLHCNSPNICSIRLFWSKYSEVIVLHRKPFSYIRKISQYYFCQQPEQYVNSLLQSFSFSAVPLNIDLNDFPTLDSPRGTSWDFVINRIELFSKCIFKDTWHVWPS